MNVLGRVLVIVLCVLPGCASHRPVQEHLVSKALSRQCEPPPILQLERSASSVPATPGQPSGGSTARPPSPTLSPHAWNFAQVIGVSDLVSELTDYEAKGEQATDRERIQLLALRQRLSETLLLRSFAIDGVAAEASCEETRVSDIADHLQKIQDHRETTLILISIVGDAMVGVAAGAIDLARRVVSGAAVAIAGGSTGAGFGIAAALVEETRELRHRRNLLREVWEGPDQPKLFPLSVWRYLTDLKYTDEMRPLRESLIADWRQDANLGAPGSEAERKRIALFFGDGGLYTVDDLRTLAQMFKELQSAISLMSQDLHVLFQEIVSSRG